MHNLRYSKNFIINLVITSIIPFLILGPFFPDLIVSVSSLFFLYHILKNKNYFYIFNKPLLIFLIFCIYCILNSFFIANDTLLSLESSLFYFRIGIFSCFVWYLIDNNKNILTFFYYAILMCFIALIIDGYFQYFMGKNLLGYKISGVRISSFFGDELIMGSYLSRLFPLLFALFIVKRKFKFEVHLLGLLFVLIDVLIYISGERSAFFFLNLSTIFIIILISEYKKFRLITFAIAIVFIFILSINKPDLNKRMFAIPAENMGFNVSETSNKSMLLDKSSRKKTIFTPVHDSHYRTAFAMFKDQPLFGHGPKMFRVVCKEEKYAIGVQPCATHPHNFYIQLLAETGIIGFLFLFSFFSYIVFISIRQFISIVFKKKNILTDYQICLISGILITVWPLAPNGNFFNNWLIIIYSLPIGFYLQSVYSKKTVN
jgi:O-antigen ligase